MKKLHPHNWIQKEGSAVTASKEILVRWPKKCSIQITTDSTTKNVLQVHTQLQIHLPESKAQAPKSKKILSYPKSKIAQIPQLKMV
jgi:hypothetical protein